MPGHIVKAVGGTVVQRHSFLTWVLDGVENSASRSGRFVPGKETRFRLSRRLDGQMCLKDIVKTDTKIFLMRYFSGTSLKIYTPARGSYPNIYVYV